MPAAAPALLSAEDDAALSVTIAALPPLPPAALDDIAATLAAYRAELAAAPSGAQRRSSARPSS